MLQKNECGDLIRQLGDTFNLHHERMDFPNFIDEIRKNEIGESVHFIDFYRLKNKSRPNQYSGLIAPIPVECIFSRMCIAILDLTLGGGSSQEIN